MNRADGFQPGYALQYDRYGNLVDSASSIPERFIQLGMVWRLGIPRTSLSAAGRAPLSFKTPATGVIFYAFANVAKTGDEVTYTLNEGGAITGGAPMVPRNLNRVTGDAACPFTDVVQGTTAGGMTLTGGVTMPPAILSGTGIGSSGAGAAGNYATGMVLKNSTVYTLDLTSIGAAIVNAVLDVAWVRALT